MTDRTVREIELLASLLERYFGRQSFLLELQAQRRYARKIRRQKAQAS